ncbi:MAG: hydrogenase nickel incorporation protein HypB [Gemmatimonadetes bacterium]|nr:hydrogenase nickel incorporation protein HypB [Gemmatimonadota bacterium]
MEMNDRLAAEVRRRLRAHGVPALNLMSSPGSGKTLLLERTLAALAGDVRIAVVVGDLQTDNDAARLARHTDDLVQAVVTGGACHLDARQILAALDAIDLARTDLLVIENVGNLVCPASWDLGEDARVVLFATTEGEDKPSKYPKMFRLAHYVVMSKIDLLPYLPFDVERAVALARGVNPALEFFRTSALTGEGMDAWLDFVRGFARRAAAPAGARERVAAGPSPAPEVGISARSATP